MSSKSSSKRSHKSEDERKSKPKRQHVEQRKSEERMKYWAHDSLQDTDDPFEDDFADHIDKPLRSN